ncbi:MAG: HAD family hydrolase [Patescibacteria group bacterium]|nr:HAD family hydrolase [Patescibacteria group bacterium]
MRKLLQRPLLAIFDWNGTLLNDLPVVYGSVVEIFKRHRLPAPSLETYRAEITTDFMKFYHAHGIPTAATAQQLNAIRKEYLTLHAAEARLHDNAQNLILLCRALGMQTAIVSGEMEEVLEKRLNDFGLTPFIDRVFGSAYDKENKLIEALDHFGVQAERAFYLDDTFDGLMAAQQVGIITFGFCGGYGTREHIRAANPDFPDLDNHGAVGEILVCGVAR